MGLLRDDSGYVLVLRKPSFISAGETAERELPKPRPVQRVDAGQAIRCSVPHCCFYCSWCGEPILMQHDRMGSPFGFPDARKIDVRSIATVCFKCNHIGTYSMFRGCRGFDTRHKILHTQISSEPALLNWLHCVEKTCTARVPFFLRVDRENPLDETDVAEWEWNDLTCALGHRIIPVPLDPTLHLPLRTPNRP
jgi:hypothetical protein